MYLDWSALDELIQFYHGRLWSEYICDMSWFDLGSDWLSVLLIRCKRFGFVYLNVQIVFSSFIQLIDWFVAGFQFSLRAWLIDRFNWYRNCLTSRLIGRSVHWLTELIDLRFMAASIDWFSSIMIGCVVECIDSIDYCSIGNLL